MDDTTLSTLGTRRFIAGSLSLADGVNGCFLDKGLFFSGVDVAYLGMSLSPKNSVWKL